MARLFARHPVTDYNTWRKIYDRFDQQRRAMGVYAHAVYQDFDNPNEVTVWLGFRLEGEGRGVPNLGSGARCYAKGGDSGQPDNLDRQGSLLTPARLAQKAAEAPVGAGGSLGNGRPFAGLPEKKPPQDSAESWRGIPALFLRMMQHHQEDFGHVATGLGSIDQRLSILPRMLDPLFEQPKVLSEPVERAKLVDQLEFHPANIPSIFAPAVSEILNGHFRKRRASLSSLSTST